MFSKNAAGLLFLALGYLGFEVAENDVVQFVSAVTTAASFALMIWNQLGRKDIKWFIFKKKD